MFFDLGFRTEIAGDLWLNMKKVNRENKGLLLGYGLWLTWNGKWKDLMVFSGLILVFARVTKIEEK